MAQNQAKVFLSELYIAPLVKIVQYRLCIYQRDKWNLVVLIRKTQVAIPG
jgi:hypothetical protein